MKQNLLVTLADVNYIKQAKQLFSSVYWNAGWKGDYMLLAHEIPEEELRWFSDKGILIKKCKPLHNKVIGKDYNPVVLDKFYLFSTEFKQWSNIVYLDSDIIVRYSLENLTKIKVFASVISSLKLKGQFATTAKPCNDIKKNYNLLKKSCNTGIFAFSSDIIHENTFNKLTELFYRYSDVVRFADEAILNLYFYKKWKEIPRVFGLDVPLFLNFKLKNKKIHAVVLHFIRVKNNEQFKPWDPVNPFYNEWITNLEKAELIDLNKTQKAENWSTSKIIYFSSLINFFLYRHSLYNKFKDFFLYKVKSFFAYKVKSFFAYKVKSSLIRIIHIPDRIIGRFGKLLGKYYPDLYNKLKK